MDINKVKKMNQITKRIEKLYNEMIKLRNEYERKKIMLSKLNEQLKELQKELESN